MYKTEERKIPYNLSTQRTHSYHFIVFPSRLLFLGCCMCVVYNFYIKDILLHTFCNPLFHLLYEHVFVSGNILLQRYFRCGSLFI